jgi:uncharacterized protein HemX
MLSDEQMDRKIREHVKAHPVILPEDYQTMVQEQIRKCCEKEMQMNTNVKKQRKKRMAAAACIVLCIGVCGAGGVRAGMNYAKQRVEQTSEKEKESLWKDAAKADADTFSRELSEKEQKASFLEMKNSRNSIRSSMNWLKNMSQKVCFRKEVFCKFRISQRSYQIRSVFWRRTALFICRRWH